jgi:hypothetical protein
MSAAHRPEHSSFAKTEPTALDVGLGCDARTNFRPKGDARARGNKGYIPFDWIGGLLRHSWPLPMATLSFRGFRCDNRGRLGRGSQSSWRDGHNDGGPIFFKNHPHRSPYRVDTSLRSGRLVMASRSGTSFDIVPVTGTCQRADIIGRSEQNP